MERRGKMEVGRASKNEIARERERKEGVRSRRKERQTEEDAREEVSVPDNRGKRNVKQGARAIFRHTGMTDS